MSDGYGTVRWTCGECGEVFESSGIVGESRVMRFRRDHRDEHRRERLSPEERRAEADAALEVFVNQRRPALRDPTKRGTP